MSLNHPSGQSDPSFDEDSSGDSLKLRKTAGSKQRRSIRKSPGELSRGYSRQELSFLYFTLDASGTVLAANPLVATTLGYGNDAFLGQPIYRLFQHRDQTRLQAHVDAFLQEPGLPLQDTYELVNQDGRQLRVNLSLQHLQGSDRDAVLLMVCQVVRAQAASNSKASRTAASSKYQQVQRLNAELERQVHARTAELEIAFEFEATLKRITDKVRDSLDEEQILQIAVQELVRSIGVKCCNAALYDLEQGTSTICYEYTTSVSPSQGRVSRLAAFPEIYSQLLEGHSFQFCSIVPSPVRGFVAMLTCPILDDQGALGDLWLINHPFYAFNEQDIRLVRQVANQCAIAIRQARLYQAAQAQVQELEKLNRLKDDFLSTVSHELRTPMSSIKMAAQMLEVVLKQEGMLQATAHRVDRYFKILNDECQREIRLINDLLDLSRLESKIEPLRPVVLDLKTWIPRQVEPFFSRMQQQQQSLQSNLTVELPPLLTDATSLSRIVIELLDNACKYTPAGERITIATDLATPSPLTTTGDPEAGTAKAIVLRVSNSGVEIPAAELPRIFDKFYRVPSHDPWRHGGTGLGLALVKELAARLGATIQVESQQGETSFAVSFPLTCPL
jgi:signal transduction histidine kinase